MPVKPLRSLRHVVHASSLLAIVSIAAPLGVLWQQPWVVWLSLWFLSQRTNFWAQLMVSLLFGLQLDVLAGWPLGTGVALVALVQGIIIFFTQARTRWKPGFLVVSGSVFSFLWLESFGGFSFWLFIVQVIGVALITSREGKGES